MLVHASRWVLSAFLFSGIVLCAQSAPPNPNQSRDQLPNSPGASRQEQHEEEKQEQKQRILGIIPNFGTTSRRDARPLTPRGKFRLFYRSAFDPMQFALVGFQAGISQAQDGFPAYGQGAAGYGKRFGAAFADQVSSGFFGNFLYPVLLKQDPRYFRLGEGSFKHRFGYALLQEVYCRTDKGGRSFAWSNVLGAFTSGGLSNLYYPQEDRGLGLTMNRSAIAIGYGSLQGLLDEFYPDIVQRVFHRRENGPSVPKPKSGAKSHQQSKEQD